MATLAGVLLQDAATFVQPKTFPPSVSGAICKSELPNCLYIIIQFYN